MSNGFDYEAGESWQTGAESKMERMSVYLEWLLTPKAERDPATKKEMAERLGVTPQTLRNYAKDPWLQRELGKRARDYAKVERVPDVLDTLYHQAMDQDNPRSVSAAKTWLDWHERTEDARSGVDLKEMSDEELGSLTQELLSRMAKNEG